VVLLMEMEVLTWIWVIGVVVVLFGAAVFVHEFGHFWMARRCGLKVEGFSIGFGPKLFGWTRDGIEYAWRWIPAGGYVKLPQMVTSETLEGKNTAESLPPVSPGAKILVALAGPCMNVVFAFVIATVLYLVGLPVLVDPAIVGGVKAGSKEAGLGIVPGDRIVAVNGEPVKSWEEVFLATVTARTNVLPVAIEHLGSTNVYQLTAKENEAVGVKLLNLEPKGHPVIRSIAAGSVAEQAGLKSEDEILSFGGVPVVGQGQLIELIRKRPGQASEIEVRRGNQKLEITVTPRLDPKTKVGHLGVEIGSSTTSRYKVQWPGPPPWQLVGEVCHQTFATFGALMHPKQTGVGIKDLSGPPGILFMLAAEAKADFRLGLKFMVLLNISLAILNLLPLPVLDGGHIGLALFEKLRGRPLSPRVQEVATSLFAILLISFMLYVSFNDVKRVPLFRSLFNQQVQIESGGVSHTNPAPK
jgi:regulator of sigma E protease